MARPTARLHAKDASMRRYRVEQVIAAARALLERIDRTNAQRETRHGPNAPAREALREALAALDKEGG
jgi:hypothetical protein